MIRISNTRENPGEISIIDLETGQPIPMVRSIEIQYNQWGAPISAKLEVLAEVDIVTEGKILRQRWNTSTDQFVPVLGPIDPMYDAMVEEIARRISQEVAEAAKTVQRQRIGGQ